MSSATRHTIPQQPATARRRFLEATARLLERQGYQSTGLNQVVRESGSPKGSLYYYFPGGKEELVAEAVRHAAAPVSARISRAVALIRTGERDAGESVRGFLEHIAHFMETSDYSAGGPISTSALEAATTSERVRTACAESYDSWITEFTRGLEAAGIAPDRAERLATLIVSTIEGAVILGRARRSAEPVRQAARELESHIRRVVSTEQP